VKLRLHGTEDECRETVELLEMSERGGGWVKACTIGATVALAAITAVVSYQHAYTVVRQVGGNSHLAAVLLPAVPDLTVLMAYLVLMENRRRAAVPPWEATAAMWGGIAVTVAMNVAAGLPYGPPAACVNALAPLALVVALHILIGRGGHGGQEVAIEGVPLSLSEPDQDKPTDLIPATLATCGHEGGQTPDEVVINDYLHHRDCLGEPLSQRKLADIHGVHRTKVAALVGPLNGRHPPDAGESSGN
jgi:hypothetical protein